MKDMMSIVSAVILLLACCLMLVSCSNSKSSNNRVAASTPSQSNQATQSSGDLQANQKQPGQQAGPELERQREQAEREARKELDQDAKTAIEQTHKAVQAISENKTEEALSNIEQATGKINILLARNPSTALIPVDLAVNVIDTAPQNKTMILEIAQDASRAFDDKNYPTARALLYMLISEIRVRTYNLPLATYPDALKEAARLLDQKQNQQASNILLTALNTLVVVDRVTPLPLVLARDAINEAQSKSKQDKEAAEASLETAKNQIERARELGYTGKDAEYAALNDQISTLEKQLKGKADTMAAFSNLKEKLGAFLKRQSSEKRG
ncbi:MAG TPA: YfdX family protein [Candidatus Sulfotelmatobacter sp.]|nr:YfdX family protein [Candidatus Sulfotelmatobacter sp.]